MGEVRWKIPIIYSFCVISFCVSMFDFVLVLTGFHWTFMFPFKQKLKSMFFFVFAIVFLLLLLFLFLQNFCLLFIC